jgi:hypothetical protein|tara:strand:- start:317 stop:565 length:249 start_codon:yes stop_codon:yes gene_type:complete
MQLISNNNFLTIDYYPAKSWIDNKIINDLNLKVVTANGKTQYKVLVNNKAMNDDILSKKDDGYSITINTKRPAQFVSFSEVI